MTSSRILLLIRAIRRDTFISVAKVIGLSIGLLVFMVMTLFVQGQLAFDSFHTKKDRIYRVNLLGSYKEAAGEEIAMSHYKMEPLLKENYPEIEEVVRLFNANQGYCTFENRKGYYETALFVDSSFFKVFDFDLIYGQKSTALLEPNSIIITESLSRQLFGEKDPVGEQIAIRYGHWVVSRNPEDRDGTITGVIKEEESSHLRFDVLTSFSTSNTLEDVNWSGPVVNTYVLLKEGASPSGLNGKLVTFYDDHHESLAEMYQPILQELGNIHLDSYHITWDPQNWKKFDRKYIRICMFLAALVLLIAAINFVQLTIGQLNDRLKSTAIRKVIGSSNWNVLVQNYFETATFCLIALLLSFLGMGILSTFLQNEFGIAISLGEIFQVRTLGILFLTSVLVVGLAGLVPAIILKSIPVSQIIAGTNVAAGKSFLSRSLIVTQLALSMGLLGGGIVVYDQIDFLLRGNSSFSQDFILQVPLSEEAKKNYTTIKQEMEGLAGVSDVTAASNAFGTIGGLDMKLKIDGQEEVLIMTALMVDHNFLDFYDIEVIQGRNFESWGKNEFIVNQAWVDNFGWENPMQEQLGFAYGKPGTVVGVVDNFNYNSLYEEVESLCIWSTNFIKLMSIKVAPGAIPSVVKRLEEVWGNHVADSPFSYSFLSDEVAEMYKTEVIIGKVVRYLTLISLLLTAIGIYALSLLVSKRKTREVSIRKVLGASADKLFISYTVEFYKLVFAALLIIVPVAFTVMSRWLENFAYTTDISTTYLVVGFVTILVISTVAIASNLFRLARTNPVEALRENG